MFKFKIVLRGFVENGLLGRKMIFFVIESEEWFI